MPSPHKCQEDTSVLLDDDFCSVINILCCVNILENCDFKFILCAVVKPVLLQRLWCGVRLAFPFFLWGWGQSAHRAGNSSVASSSPLLILLLSLTAFRGEGLQNSASSPFLVLCARAEHQQFNILHPDNTFAGNSLCKCSLISKCSVINLPRSCCWCY